MAIVTFGDRTGATYAGAEDVLLKEANPTINQNPGEALEANKFDTADFNYSLIKFPTLATILAGRADAIQVATLNLYIQDTDGADYTVNLHRMLRDWGESTATWVDYNSALVSSFAKSNETDTVDEVSGTIAWQKDSLVVVLGMTANNDAALISTPTWSDSASFGALSGTPTNVGSTCKAYGWSAVANAAGSGTISAATSGANRHSVICVFVYPPGCSVGNVSVDASLGATTVQSLTRSAANSAVAQLWGDWNATNDTTVAWTPSGQTQRLNSFVSGQATYFAADWGPQGAAGTANYGFSGFAGGNMTAITVEIIPGSWTTPGALSDGNDRVATESANWLSSGANLNSFISVSGAQLLADIKAIVAGAIPNYGWGLFVDGAADAGAFRQYSSSDHSTPAQRPYLELTLLDVPWNLRLRQNRPAPFKPGRGR